MVVILNPNQNEHWLRGSKRRRCGRLLLLLRVFVHQGLKLYRTDWSFIRRDPNKLQLFQYCSWAVLVPLVAGWPSAVSCNDDEDGGEMSDQNQEWGIVIPFIIALQYSPASPCALNSLATHTTDQPPRWGWEKKNRLLARSIGDWPGRATIEKPRWSLHCRRHHHHDPLLCGLVIILHLSFQSNSTTCVFSCNHSL